jgi:uncharacterized cupredoxin-like copper-binding protein
MLRKYLAPILILIAASLSACQANSPSTSIDLELSDFQISPERLVVPAGAEISLHVTNTGLTTHDFTVMELGVDVGNRYDQEDQGNVYWAIEVRSGETRTVQFQSPTEPGIYQIVCSMPGHVQAGMLGSLEVVARK